jgi:hypothetical protein
VKIRHSWILMKRRRTCTISEVVVHIRLLALGKIWIELMLIDFLVKCFWMSSRRWGPPLSSMMLRWRWDDSSIRHNVVGGCSQRVRSQMKNIKDRKKWVLEPICHFTTTSHSALLEPTEATPTTLISWTSTKKWSSGAK